MRKSYVFLCQLRGNENRVYREIEVPAYLTLEDFCYCVLGSFNAEGYHMFSVDFRKNTYYCNNFESDFLDNVYYLKDYTLDEMNIRKNSKMMLTYDFGDNYEIIINLKEIRNNDYLFELEDMKLIDGKGYGIWEDNHYLLDMFYYDQEQYKEFIENEGYEIEWTPMEEEYNIKEKNLYEDFMCYRSMIEDSF